MLIADTSSAALSVKMSAILYLPGLLLILLKRRGLLYMLYSLLNVVVTQAYIARPFLEAEPWSYLRYSFDFSRAFLYKWTVNWRFVSEDIFLSRQWAVGLLIGHAAVLALFGLFRWCRKDGNSWIVM